MGDISETPAQNTVRVAVSQHEPCWLDLQASVSKTIDIIREAAGKGCKLVAFSECWVPGYPAWIWTRNVDFDLGVKYVQNSLAYDSAEMRRICEAAKENAIAVSLGFSERKGNSVYIAQCLIGEDGIVKVLRRKMKPTHMERTIFGDATGGECLSPVAQVNGVGKVGMLSCWEHIQPLLKYWVLSQGEEIHVAAWPPLDGFVEGSPGFYSMSIEGARTAAQQYAVESQAFVLHCAQVISEKGTKLMGTEGSPLMGHPVLGSSAVVGPDGRILTKAATQNEELIVADLDLNLVVKAKTFADAAGHYSRPDMLWLGADPAARPIVKVQPLMQ